MINKKYFLKYQKEYIRYSRIKLFIYFCTMQWMVKTVEGTFVNIKTVFPAL